MKKTLIFFIYLIFLVAVIEVCARGYYVARRGMSFFSSAQDQIYMWYPQLKEIYKYNYDEDSFNLLLLGGSVLTEDWGQVPKYLNEKIEKILGVKPNVLNLAAAAHTSLDSLNKYRSAEGKSFDLVVFYHGINEVRANNVPPDRWKDDYSHYSWYDEVNFYFRHPFLKKFGLVFPYYIKHLLVNLDRKVLNTGKYVPEHTPREEWLRYGSDIKSSNSFRKNLEEIIAIANGREEPLLIMSFAYCAPVDCEFGVDDKFVKSAELWGKCSNVKMGIRAHNGVVRDLSRDKNFIFLDQEKLLGDNAVYYSDICHFSKNGSDVFSENLVREIQKFNSSGAKENVQ